MFSHVKFAELKVSDLDRAIGFYTGKVGLTLASDAPYGEGGGRWVELAIQDGQTRILLTPRPDETPSQQPDLILVTADVAAAHATLRERGVAFTQDPADAPWAPGETYALFRDSEGNLVMLGNG